MYEKETLELKDVMQMLQNNELMKKTDSTEDVLRLIVKRQRGRSQSRESKKDSSLAVCLLLLQKTRAH